VRVEDSPAVYTDADFLRSVAVIVQVNTMNTIADDELSGLVAAVRAGTGLVGWHGGIADSYRNSADYLHLIGGQFAHHPIKAPPADLPGDGTDCFVEHLVNIVPEQRDHPIVRGISDFTLTTEQYWVLSDGYNEVLATTTLAARDFDAWNRPVTCPAVWTRQWGEGRIVVCTPGHQLAIVNDPNVRTIIERGILWASR
jgi:type 1 glutamine amidotransferase